MNKLKVNPDSFQQVFNIFENERVGLLQQDRLNDALEEIIKENTVKDNETNNYDKQADVKEYLYIYHKEHRH